MISAPHSPLNTVLSLVSETSWKLETEVLFWTRFFFFRGQGMVEVREEQEVSFPRSLKSHL